MPAAALARRRADGPAAHARSTATTRRRSTPTAPTRARTTSRSPRSCRPSSPACSTRARRPAAAARVLLGGAPAARRCSQRARDAGWPVAPDLRAHRRPARGHARRARRRRDAGRAAPRHRASRIAHDGEILVAGPTVAGGGRLRTGDLGRLDDDGPPDRHRPQVRHDRHRRRERRARRGRGGAARASRRSPRPACSPARTRSGARR